MKKRSADLQKSKLKCWIKNNMEAEELINITNS